VTPSPGHTHRAGVELRFWEWPGDPPPTLLLHGIGNYGRYWDLFASAIDGRLRLIAPDARGHGDSGKPHNGYAPAEFVADALAVLDTLAVERALVVGHSMGGTHAMRLAAAHPDRVLGLVLVDVGPETLREGAERARRLTTTRPERFADREEALAYLRATSPGYSDAVYANRLDWALREELGGLVWRSSAHALARILATRASAGELWTKLRAVRCPVLLVRGTRSNVLSAEVARRMVQELSGPTRADLIELDTGHNVALERPRELAEAVVALARAVRASPGR
jgi:pimeloyl-ACP methyl ester carboxylesterase